MSDGQGNVNQGLRFSRASVEDWNVLWPIAKEVLAAGDQFAHSPDTPEHVVRDYFLGADRQCFIASDDIGKVLGFYRILPVIHGQCAHTATGSFMVNSSCRGMGVGKALVYHALTEAAKSGFKAIRFNHVVSTNYVAIMLYLKMGFKILATIPKAYKSVRSNDYIDVYLMYRNLDDYAAVSAA